MSYKKKEDCKRNEWMLISMSILVTTFLLVGLSADKEGVSFDSLSSGNLLTGAVIGIQGESVVSDSSSIGILGSGLGAGETPLLNSSSLANQTDENITGYYYEGAGNKTIIDWKLNGTSIAILNMPFEGGSNSTYTKDYSSFDNNGNITGATWNASEGYDSKGAYEFINDGDHINLGNDTSLDLVNDFTLEAWIYPKTIPATTPSDVFLSKYYSVTENNYVIGIRNTDEIYFMWGNGEFNLLETSTSPLSTNTWFHVVIKREGTDNPKIYINNIEQTSSCLVGNCNSTFISTASNLVLGKASSAEPGNDFKGYIDEVRIYNRSLSTEQISALYNNRTDLIISNETTLGDNWSVCVTPNDGTEDGTGVCSSNLTVIAENNAPNTASVILNATSPNNYSTDDLTCYTNITDADGGSVYANYTWYKDSVLNLTGQSAIFTENNIVLISTLNAANTTAGENWTCSIKAYDGTDYEADWNNGSLVIQNTAAVLSNLVINSTSLTNTTSENITAYWDVTDVNGDAVKNITNWYVDGSSIAVLNMPFEADGGQNATDYSGYGNNGTNKGATWNASGGYDGKGAYKFDNVASHINLTGTSNTDFTTEDFTILAWVYPYSNDAGIIYANRYEIAGTDSGWMLGLDSSGAVDFDINGDSDNGVENSNSAAYVANKWQLVGVVKEGTTQYYYVDGVSKGSDSVGTSGTIVYSGGMNNRFIGKYTDTANLNHCNGNEIPTCYFDGLIDEITIYNRALSFEQISSLYNNKINLIISNETVPGDNWSVCVTPNDGAEDGAEVCSENLTIIAAANNIPNTAQVILNATSINNNSEDNLTCYTNVTDADGGSVYANYTWYKDSILNLTGQSAIFTENNIVLVSTLNAANTTAGENWTCSIMAYDGTDYESDWNNASINISDCGKTITNSVTLTKDLVCQGSGIVIGADDITIDCANNLVNYSIGGTLGYGVNNTGFNNVTVKNCRIYEGNITTSAKYPIYLGSINNGTIQNVTINAIGAHSSGIFLSTVNSVNVTNVTITTTDSRGIELTSSNNNTIVNCNVSTSVASQRNGFALSSSDSNSFSDNFVQVTGTSSISASVSSSDSNIFTNNTFITTSTGTLSSAFYVYGTSENNVIINNNFSTTINKSILDTTGNSYFNILVYNNSLGEINWNKTNLTVELSLGLGVNVYVENNNLGLANHVNLSNINSTAQLKFYGLNSTTHWLYKNGIRCDDSVLCNITTDSSGTVIATVSSFSNYTTVETCGVTITANTNLVADITSCPGNGLQISASNIILDCSGYSVVGDGGAGDRGISSTGTYSNITIKNCVVKNFGYGINLTHSHNSTIFNNTIGHVNITGNSAYGIYLVNSTKANISNNRITNITGDAIKSPTGIYFIPTQSDNLFGSVISNNNISHIYGKDNVFPIGITLGIPEWPGLVNGIKIDNNIIKNINCTSASGGSTCELVDGGFGITIDDGTNVNITNNNIGFVGLGILPNTNGLRIVNNLISTSTLGIYPSSNGASSRFNHSWIENNTFDRLSQALYLDQHIYNNTFLNNNFSNSLQYAILDYSAYNNTLIYNNSAGEIKWGKINLSTNITLAGNVSAYLMNNIVGLVNDVNTLKLNETAQITFRGLNTTTHLLFKDGVRCDNLDICNITFDSTGTVVAKVSSFSNFTTLEEKEFPVFNPIPQNQTILYGNQFNYDINATDDVALSNYSVNDTSFRINASGNIENVTSLHLALYWLNITINDTSNNLNSTLIFVNVTDTTYPYFINVPQNQTLGYGDLFAYQINATDNYNISSYTVNDTTNFKINSSGYLENATAISVGFYNLNVSINDSSNNTNSSVFFVNVTDTIAPYFVNLPQNQTVAYGNAFAYQINTSDNHNVSNYIVNDTNNFKINSSGYLENATAISVGLYNLNVSINDSSNNINSSVFFVNVTDTIVPYFVNLPQNQTIGYGNSFAYQINASDNHNVSNYIVNDTNNFKINSSGYLENATAISVGLYNLNVNINDSSNNINSSVFFVNVTDTIAPYFVNLPQNQTVAYGSSFAYQINASDNYNVSNYTINDTTNFKINSSGYLENATPLSVRIYNLNVNINDTFNNTNSSVFFVNVTDTIAPYFVNLPQNQTIGYGESFAYQINASDNHNVSSYTVNDTTRFGSTSAGNIVNISALSIGLYYLNISIGDQFNNINSSIFFVNVTDTTFPYFVNLPQDQTIGYGNSFAYQINTSDNYNVSNHTINDTTRFKINQSGYLENATNLSIGLYNLNVSVNDTFDNTNSSVFFVNITDQRPNVTLTSPAASYSNSSAALTNITFICNVTDDFMLANLSLYLTGSDNTGFIRNQSSDVNGLINSSNWTVELGVGTYTWNCLSQDIANNNDWGNTNRTITLNYDSSEPDAVVADASSSSSGSASGKSCPIGSQLVAGKCIEIIEEEIIEEVPVKEEPGSSEVEEKEEKDEVFDEPSEDLPIATGLAFFDQAKILFQDYSSYIIAFAIFIISLIAIAYTVPKLGKWYGKKKSESRFSIRVRVKRTIVKYLKIVGFVIAYPFKKVVFAVANVVLFIGRMFKRFGRKTVKHSTQIADASSDALWDTHKAIKRNVRKSVRETGKLAVGIGESTVDTKRSIRNYIMRQLRKLVRRVVKYILAFIGGIIFVKRSVRNYIMRQLRKLVRRVVKHSTRVSDATSDAALETKRAVRKSVRGTAQAAMEFGDTTVKTKRSIRNYIMRQLRKLVRRVVKHSTRVSDATSDAALETKRAVRKSVRGTAQAAMEFGDTTVKTKRSIRNYIMRQLRKLVRRIVKHSTWVSDATSDAALETKRAVRKSVRGTAQAAMEFGDTTVKTKRSIRNYIMRQLRKLLRRVVKYTLAFIGGIIFVKRSVRNYLMRQLRKLSRRTVKHSTRIAGATSDALWDTHKAVKKTIKKSAKKTNETLLDVKESTLVVGKKTKKQAKKHYGWTIAGMLYLFKALFLMLFITVKRTFKFIGKVIFEVGKSVGLLIKAVILGLGIMFMTLVKALVHSIRFVYKEIKLFVVWNKTQWARFKSWLIGYIWQKKSFPQVKIKGSAIPTITLTPLKKKPIKEIANKRKPKLMEELEQIDLRLKTIDKPMARRFKPRFRSVVSKERKVGFAEEKKGFKKLKEKPLPKATILEPSPELLKLNRELGQVTEKLSKENFGIRFKEIDRRVKSFNNVKKISAADRRAIAEVKKISKKLEMKHRVRDVKVDKLTKDLEKVNLSLARLDEPVVKKIVGVTPRKLVEEKKTKIKTIKVSKKLEEKKRLELQRLAQLNKELSAVEMRLSDIDFVVGRKRIITKVSKYKGKVRPLDNKELNLNDQKAMNEAVRIINKIDRKHLLETKREQKLERELGKIEKKLGGLR
jgi:hypothetical protein